MIRYYNGEQFLGYLVGKCPKTGKPVLVDDGMNYYTPRVITHKVVGETILDERTQPPLEQGDSKTDTVSRHFLRSAGGES